LDLIIFKRCSKVDSINKEYQFLIIFDTIKFEKDRKLFLKYQEKRGGDYLCLVKDAILDKIRNSHKLLDPVEKASKSLKINWEIL